MTDAEVDVREGGECWEKGGVESDDGCVLALVGEMEAGDRGVGGGAARHGGAQEAVKALVHLTSGSHHAALEELGSEGITGKRLGEAAVRMHGLCDDSVQTGHGVKRGVKVRSELFNCGYLCMQCFVGWFTQSLGRYPEDIAGLDNDVKAGGKGVLERIEAQFVFCQLIPRESSHGPCKVRPCSDVKECMTVCLKFG